MWQPQPGWQRLPGTGASSDGVWAAQEGNRPVVVKRLVAPSPDDPDVRSVPGHPAYWRRAAEVALSGVVATTAGLREAPAVRVEEDDEGITLVHEWVEAAPHAGPFLARALGRFTGADLGAAPWLAREQLDARVEQVERRGGWRTLERTPVADLCDALWRRRGTYLARLASMPQVAQHGDPVPGNLVGREGEDVVAIDWATLGHGPAGGDVGYLALSVPEGFDTLLAAYLSGAQGEFDVADVALAARTTAVFTVLTRVDWALSRAAPGEGALAGKFRHPSLAPYVRAMQRQLPQMESLLTS